MRLFEQILAIENEGKHARVAEGGIGDEDLAHPMLECDCTQAIHLGQHRTIRHILAAVLVTVIQEPHDFVSGFGVVLELLQQPNRGDSGTDDECGDIVRSGASHALLNPVEDGPTCPLQDEIEARAGEDDDAPELTTRSPSATPRSSDWIWCVDVEIRERPYMPKNQQLAIHGRTTRGSARRYQ